MLFILSGPSGSGKTTLYQKLLRDPLFKGRLVKSVSMTTRAPRPGEKNGREYFFVSERMFDYKLRAGHFLESERVFNASYGTPRGPVRQQLRRGEAVLLCIDVKGARTVMQSIPDACSIFIKPPSLRVLRERLTARQTESAEALRLRLDTARQELAEAGRYQQVLVNDDLDRAYAQLRDIIAAHLPPAAGKGPLGGGRRKKKGF